MTTLRAAASLTPVNSMYNATRRSSRSLRLSVALAPVLVFGEFTLVAPDGFGPDVAGPSIYILILSHVQPATYTRFLTENQRALREKMGYASGSTAQETCILGQ